MGYGIVLALYADYPGAADRKGDASIAIQWKKTSTGEIKVPEAG